MERISNEVSIALVIVFFNPSLEDIEHAKALAIKWDGVIVDNSVNPCIGEELIGKMQYIPLRGNRGIAEAQNIGINAVMSKWAPTHVVFLDQDSRASVSYPEEIVNNFLRIKKAYSSLCCLGPSVINKTTGEEYKSVIHTYASTNDGFSLRTHIISSGCCVETAAFEIVGLMDSRMFIDYVDYEWCWRANAKGLGCGLTNNVTLVHKVGKRELSLGRYKVIISSPNRYFYQYRNFIWLIRKKYVPLQWKFATGVKFFFRLLYFPLFVRDGVSCWINMINGIKSGFNISDKVHK